MSKERSGFPTWLWIVGVGALLVYLGLRARQRRAELDDYLA